VASPAQNREKASEVTKQVRGLLLIEVVFAWKQVWQCGVVRVHGTAGSVVEVPYRLCLEPTFDQRQVERPA
jgi:hypothetical protein